MKVVTWLFFVFGFSSTVALAATCDGPISDIAHPDYRTPEECGEIVKNDEKSLYFAQKCIGAVQDAVHNQEYQVQTAYSFKTLLHYKRISSKWSCDSYVQNSIQRENCEAEVKSKFSQQIIVEAKLPWGEVEKTWPVCLFTSSGNVTKIRNINRCQRGCFPVYGGWLQFD